MSTINTFKTIKNYIDPIFNDECIFCFEDINKYTIEDINKHTIEDINKHTIDKWRYDSIKESNIILSCNHVFHNHCFTKYLFHKLRYINRNCKIILKCDDVKCPICMRVFHYLTVWDLLKTYKNMMKNDKIDVKKEINKISYEIKKTKFIFFINKLLNKDIYIAEIYNNFKMERRLEKLRRLKKDIAKRIDIMESIKIY